MKCQGSRQEILLISMINWTAWSDKNSFNLFYVYSLQNILYRWFLSFMTVLKVFNSSSILQRRKLRPENLVILLGLTSSKKKRQYLNSNLPGSQTPACSRISHCNSFKWKKSVSICQPKPNISIINFSPYKKIIFWREFLKLVMVNLKNYLKSIF